jgi:cell fate regulator YaaT (PSP1 superfamily)
MGCCTSYSRGCFNNIDDTNQESKPCQPSSINKLNVHDWLKGYHNPYQDLDLVEVRFKNTRKLFFNNVNGLALTQGDLVAVEASPGHDIGVVSLTGSLVKEQIIKSRTREKEFKKIYRKAKPLDLEKWEEARNLEKKTMLRSRILARELGLDMKIGDVEYQGDKTKAIFYYIADERVDFRQLIKNLAEEFSIRVEMRQIGARQEAGRIGGIGSCGNELCCSKWMSTFSSVSTNAAREQEMSLNPQKLAGQCGKLKCCLNFEVEVYKDAKKAFPNTKIVLDTDDGPAFYHKSDVLQNIMWYSFDKNYAANLTPLPVDRVKEIIEINKTGKKVDALLSKGFEDVALPDFDNIVGQDSLTRFDKPKKKNKKPYNKKKRFNNKKGRNQAPQKQTKTNPNRSNKDKK